MGDLGSAIEGGLDLGNAGPAAEVGFQAQGGHLRSPSLSHSIGAGRRVSSGQLARGWMHGCFDAVSCGDSGAGHC